MDTAGKEPSRTGGLCPSAEGTVRLVRTTERLSSEARGGPCCVPWRPLRLPCGEGPGGRQDQLERDVPWDGEDVNINMRQRKRQMLTVDCTAVDLHFSLF